MAQLSAPCHQRLVLPSQVHGFPKVMGVLTHLDEFTDPSKLKKDKKTLKARQPDGASVASR